VGRADNILAAGDDRFNLGRSNLGGTAAEAAVGGEKILGEGLVASWGEWIAPLSPRQGVGEGGTLARSVDIRDITAVIEVWVSDGGTRRAV